MLLYAHPASKLDPVPRTYPYLPLAFLIGAQAGCGPATGASGAGTGPIPPEQTSEHALSCTIGDLTLEIPIELTYTPDRPFIAGARVNLDFSATVTFDEAFSAAIIDAGVSKIDIMVIDVASSVSGAIPASFETSLAGGINDFDLTIDTNDNGAPGPQSLELRTVTTTLLMDQDADQVLLGLGLDGLFFMLGDFEIPIDCVEPTLIGFAASFDVAPAG